MPGRCCRGGACARCGHAVGPGGSPVSIKAIEQRIEALRGMRLRELRRALEDMGLDTAGRVDKESLDELLLVEGAAVLLRPPWERKGRKPPPAPLEGNNVNGALPNKGKSDTLVVFKQGSGAIAVDIDICRGGCIHHSRFVLDTNTNYSVIKKRMALDKLGAAVKGTPAWATEEESAFFGLKQVLVGNLFVGKLECGKFTIASVDRDVSPVGTSGVLGLDFLRIFDWEIDMNAGKVKVTVAQERDKGKFVYK